MKTVLLLHPVIISVQLFLVAATERRLDWHEKKPEEWYQRYSVYPPYCSTPEQMAARDIPVLDNSAKYGLDAQLVHITAVIRHGARTPWTSDLHCWENYWTDPETGSWNCDLTTWLAPPSPRVVEQEMEETMDTSGSGAMFLFEKQYNSLLYPRNNLTNLLNGTCQLGQLLLMGYEQQITNGKQFRQAYVYDSKNLTAEGLQTDPRMHLIDVASSDVSTDDDSFSGDSQPWNRRNLYLRADDDQRTVMSGQVLLRGMFGREIENYFFSRGEYPVLPVHTADRVQDILGANDKVCPRLLQLKQEFQQSEIFRSYMSSREAQTLLKFQRDVLKLPEGQKMDAIDCLMTTICTDRGLPEAVNDYKGDLTVEKSAARGNDLRLRHLEEYGDNMFERLYNWDVQGYVNQQIANDAEFAKLSMSFLWTEIMETIYAVVAEKDGANKFTLISGHDTTIMPLLASLGPRVFDEKWSPYASKMVIEIFKLGPTRDVSVFASNFAFRLHYNGKVLTPFIDHCPSDLQLCDAQVLIQRVRPFATRNLNCHMDSEPESKPTWQNGPGLTTADDVALVVLSLMSALVGSLVTYLYMARAAATKGYTKQRRQRANDGVHHDSLTLEVSADNIDDSEGQFA